jgi:triosephosphate isomerase
MNAANAASLLAQPDIDGGLIGGGSFESAGFLDHYCCGCLTKKLFRLSI